MNVLAMLKMIPPKIRFAIGAAIVSALEYATGLLGGIGELVMMPIEMLLIGVGLLPSAKDAAESAMLLLSVLV